MSTSVRQLKTALRKQVKASLQKIGNQDLIDQSAKIALALRQLPVYAAAKNVGFYMNMDLAEVKTLLLIKNAFEDGKAVFLPRCKYNLTLTPQIINDSPTSAIGSLDFSLSLKKNHLVFYHVKNFNSVMELEPLGPYNLKEPAEGGASHCFHLSFSGLDLLVMPGVAFSIDKQQRIKRLGHGAGFYDEFIKRHKDFTRHYNEKVQKDGDKGVKKSPFLLGVGLEEQLVEDVPTDKWDEDLDGLIVEDRFYHFMD